MPGKWWEESLFLRVQGMVPWSSWEGQPARTAQDSRTFPSLMSNWFSPL